MCDKRGSQQFVLFAGATAYQSTIATVRTPTIRFMRGDLARTQRALRNGRT